MAACILIVTNLAAQPIFNLSGMPPLGALLTSSEVDGTGITPGPSGTNQT